MQDLSLNSVLTDGLFGYLFLFSFSLSQTKHPSEIEPRQSAAGGEWRRQINTRSRMWGGTIEMKTEEKTVATRISPFRYGSCLERCVDGCPMDGDGQRQAAVARIM